MKRRILITRAYISMLLFDCLCSPFKSWKAMRAQSKSILDHVRKTTKDKKWKPYKGKLGVIIFCLFASVASAQQNRKTYSYSINQNYKVGYNLEGTVLLKRVEQNWKLREHYVILVNGNATSKVLIQQRAVFNLIKEKDYLVLPSCNLLIR